MRLREARMEAGLTQGELAGILNISEVYLKKMEQSRRKLTQSAVDFIEKGIQKHETQ